MTPNIDAVLGRLDKVKQIKPNEWKACCPAHDDKNPSLSIKLTDDGKILFFCRSHECSYEAIKDGLGSDLFKKNNRAYRGPSKKDIKHAESIKFVAEHSTEPLSEEDEETVKQSDEILQKAEIAELALLDQIEYDKQRKEVAERLGVRVSTLDKAVAACRKTEKKEGSIGVSAPEPAAEEVDGDSLLCEISDIFTRFLVLPADNVESIFALWVMHTYVFDYFDAMPYLALLSPQRRCGKSTALILLSHFANKPIVASNCTPAAMFRVIAEYSPSLFIDECDAFLNENNETRGIVNQGHLRETAYVLRCVGDDNRVERFPTFTPMALASIKKLPSTIMDRSIIIRMQRKPKGPGVEKLRSRKLKEYDDIQGRCVRWAADNGGKLSKLEPALPEHLNDRQADILEPLFSICDRVGGDWRKQLEAFADDSKGEDVDDSLSTQLLKDIQVIFKQPGALTDGKIPSADLVDRLNKMNDAPWAVFRDGKGISQRALSNMLRDFSIRPKKLRAGKKPFNGYASEYFTEIFTRYIAENECEAEG